MGHAQCVQSTQVNCTQVQQTGEIDWLTLARWATPSECANRVCVAPGYTYSAAATSSGLKQQHRSRARAQDITRLHTLPAGKPVNPRTRAEAQAAAIMHKREHLQYTDQLLQVAQSLKAGGSRHKSSRAQHNRALHSHGISAPAVPSCFR